MQIMIGSLISLGFWMSGYKIEFNMVSYRGVSEYCYPSLSKLVLILTLVISMQFACLIRSISKLIRFKHIIKLDVFWIEICKPWALEVVDVFYFLIFRAMFPEQDSYCNLFLKFALKKIFKYLMLFSLSVYIWIKFIELTIHSNQFKSFFNWK